MVTVAPGDAVRVPGLVVTFMFGASAVVTCSVFVLLRRFASGPFVPSSATLATLSTAVVPAGYGVTMPASTENCWAGSPGFRANVGQVKVRMPAATAEVAPGVAEKLPSRSSGSVLVTSTPVAPWVPVFTTLIAQLPEPPAVADPVRRDESTSSGTAITMVSSVADFVPVVPSSFGVPEVEPLVTVADACAVSIPAATQPGTV